MDFRLRKEQRDIQRAARKFVEGEFSDMLPKSKAGKLLRREIRGEEKRRVEA